MQHLKALWRPQKAFCGPDPRIASVLNNDQPHMVNPLQPSIPLPPNHTHLPWIVLLVSLLESSLVVVEVEQLNSQCTSHLPAEDDPKDQRIVLSRRVSRPAAGLA